MKKELVDSFKLRVQQESFERIEKCLSMLTEDQVWFTPNLNIPPVGNLILHLCGNVRQWVLTGIGNQPDVRDRDGEFEQGLRMSKNELSQLMKELSEDLDRYFIEMREDDLQKSIVVQGYNASGFAGMIHVIEHFSYHTGQITTLTKLITNEQTNYYEGIDLNA